MTRRLTGSEIIVEMLIEEGMPYVIGIPGHGNLPLVDACRRHQDQIQVIMPRHEQAGVHMADGYFRACGKPLAVYTSIGAGAANTALGLATAYADSIPLLLLIGETHTYMRGVGVLQEIDRQYWSDLPRTFDPLVKRSWRIDRARQLPRAVGQAFNTMLTGRPGPALITLPMDVQAETIELDEIPKPQNRRPQGAPGGDPAAIQQAADLLQQAKRPVILAGGGVILAGAEAELRRLAEHLGAAVVTTMQGKGAFPEDHPLYGWHMGSNGTTCGNHLTNNADVLLAVGVRFADKATSSYRPGYAFNIPPTQLIHVDIDPFEIGKNYPVEVGIVGDAKGVLRDLGNSVTAAASPRDWQKSAYAQEIAREVNQWLDSFRDLQESNQSPPTMGRVIAEVRRVLPQDGLVFTSAGNPAKYTAFFKEKGLIVVHVVANTKFAKKCEEAGVDAIVAEGFEAGGHNGIEETTTMALIPMVRQVTGLPLIAAGGIASGRAMLAAFALGADGVQIGSRFAASEESSGHENFKKAIVDAGDGATRLTLKRLIPVRLLKNKFYEQVTEMETRGATREELMELLGRGRAKIGMFEGDTDEGELEIGQVSGMIHEIKPAAEILREVIEEFEMARKELANLEISQFGSLEMR